MSNKSKDVNIRRFRNKKSGGYVYTVGTSTTKYSDLEQARAKKLEMVEKYRTKAQTDSTKRSDKITSLIKTKADLAKTLADMDSFDPDADQTKDSLFVANQINQINKQLGKMTGITDSTVETVKKQKTQADGTKPKGNWITNFLYGTKEEQAKGGWIESWQEIERNNFQNKNYEELDIPDEWKSNPDKWWEKENKKRTNQWYQEKADEAYNLELKNRDPLAILK